MPRCAKHKMNEPCYYCIRGVQPFTTTTLHLDALEDRLKNLESTIHGEAPILPDGLDLRAAVGVIRDYALGDIVMLAPALKALKEKDPNRPLVLLTRPELFDVLAGAGYLDAQLPKSSFEHTEFYQRFDLCHAVETEAGGTLPVKDYLSKSRPDNFAELLGVAGGAEKFPVPVNREALNKMRAILSGYPQPIIGIAATCNSSVRTIPPEYIAPLAKKVLERFGGTVVLLGKTVNWNRSLADIKGPHILNLIDTLQIKELIAAISLMNAMISPDTGTMHLAGALGVKCLCLMGDNDPKCFSDFYPTVKVMQPSSKEMPCVPCNDRSIPCTPLPKGQFGAACMQAMTPEKVMVVFGKFYNGKNIAYLHDTPLTFIGGAEINSREMIKAGREMGYNIRLFDRETPVEQFHSLYGYDLIILSNIWRFPKETMAVIMQAIRNVPYIKYENDHDGLEPAPQGYSREEFARRIYGQSALNIFLSPAHQADYVALGPGISIPSPIDVGLFKPVAGVQRKPKTALIGVPGKWDRKNLDDWIKDHQDLQVTILNEKIPHKQMPTLYSQFEYFAHFPQRAWSFERVIFEAALCGCKVMTDGHTQGMSWDKDLTDAKGLRDWLKKVPEQFWGEVDAALSAS